MEPRTCMIVLLKLTVCFLSVSVSQVQGVITDNYGNSVADDGTISWAPLPTGNKSYVTNSSYSDDGLGMLFAFARNFINTVQPNDFPFELMSSVLSGEFDLGQNYMQLVQYAMGFAVLFAIGLLFVIFLPLCGCCICCCRCCCGNCGGDLKATYDKNEDCKRMGLAQALFMLVILMGASAGCVWMTNGRFSVALEYTKNSISDNLDDFKTFFENTADQFLYLATDMYALVHQAIIQDIGDIGNVMNSLLVSSLDIDDVITSVKELDTRVYNISDALSQVITDIDSLTSAADNLTSALDTLATNINSTVSTCSASGVACQAACDSIDTSVLTSASADFSSLPDLTSVQSSVDAVKALNLTGQIEAVESGLDGITVMIDSAAASAQTNNLTCNKMFCCGMQYGRKPFILTKMCAEVNTTMNLLAGQVNVMCDEVVEKLNESVDPASFKTELGSFFGMMQTYDGYRVYFGYGLTGLFTGLVLVTLLALICGCCGHDSEKLPTERGCLSNLGGCCLIIPVVVMFIVGSLLMLLTSLTFVVGGNMEKLCQPLIDLTIFSEFIDQGGIPGFSIGALLLGNASVDVGIYNFLLGCRADRAPFKLLGLDTLLPLDDILNTSQYTAVITNDMSNLSSAVDLSSFVVLTPGIKSGLEGLRNSGLSDINFTQINNVVYIKHSETPVLVSQSVVNINVDLFIIAMKAVRDSCTGATRASWNSHISDMEDIRDTYIPAVESAQTQLLSSLSPLETLISGLDTKINNTLDVAEAAEDQLQNNSTGVVDQAVSDYASRILNYVDQFATQAKYLAYNEIAKCLPVWNIYDSFTTILCSYTVDSLNAFWFGTGWGLLFFIPVMVLSVKLSKYYRRMNEQEGYKEEEEPEDEDIDDFEVRYDMMNRHNKVAPDPDYYD